MGVVYECVSVVECSFKECGNRKKKSDNHGPHKMKRCGRCKTSHYCSTRCQRGDWPVHKLLCERSATSDAMCQRMQTMVVALLNTPAFSLEAIQKNLPDIFFEKLLKAPTISFDIMIQYVGELGDLRCPEDPRCPGNPGVTDAEMARSLAWVLSVLAEQSEEIAASLPLENPTAWYVVAETELFTSSFRASPQPQRYLSVLLSVPCGTEERGSVLNSLEIPLVGHIFQ